MITQLDLYILNNDNSVAPFPSEAEQIVLYDFAFEAQRMGAAPEITATIQANGSLENSLTTKVFCEYNGERYFLKNLPSSAKENTDPRYTFDLTFVSERTILDNVYMIDAVQGDSNIDRYQSNSTNIVFMGTIEECVARLNAAMTYAGVGYSVVLDEGITTESKLVSFQDKFFTEALQEIVNIHNIPYYYVGKVIHFGWSQTTIPTLKYGDGLLSINKSIRTERIVNRATATGSTENIPYYYPNPTPNGYITPVINDRSGAGISVIDESKLGKLSLGSKLRYCDFRSLLAFNGFYVSYNAPSAGVESSGTPEYVEGYPPLVTIKPNRYSFVYIKVKWSSDSNEVADFKIKYDYSILTAGADSIKFIDVNAYKLEKVNTNLGIIDSAKLDDSISTSIFGNYIYINGLPSNRDVYIGLVYHNTSTNTAFGEFEASTESLLEDGWYIHKGDVRVEDYPVNISKYGVVSNLTPAEGDEVSYSVIKKIPVATTLMPPIYRETDGAQRFYNAINGAYEGVTFENEYSAENPKEAITKFEDIKPTIVGVTNANGERIDMFAEFAYDLNDSDETEQTDENSESFIHPYFYAKLHKIDGDNGFNLFAQAIESGEMTIEMTSGHCGACKFVIAVDENTQRNLVMVDDNGNLIYDDATGKVKMADDATGLDRQNDTQNYEVWIALKKDINTFGTVMPMANSTIKPSADDTFVITNILLPQAYFTAAEKKLEDEIIAFLAKNNAFQFEYDINFSRIFLKKRNDVYSKLTENSIIPIEYNGNKLSFYVSSYTYRKQKGEVLPEISVSLTDNFDSTPSAFQQSINAIQENIVRGIGAVGFTLEDTDPRYLRKDVADTVKERTTFEKGMDFGGTLTSKGFKKGNLIGAGFGVYTDENGNSVVEADRMVIRKDAQFSEIVINQTTFQLGATVFSGGGCNITDVEEVEGAYRCYYDNKSGTRFSGFVVGDQARCQRFDESQKEVIKYYWRVVVAVGDNYVDLSTTDVDGTGIPEVGDDIVHFGNRTDSARQNVIVIASTPAPTILQYDGIKDFTLPNPVTKITPNDNEFSGRFHIRAGSTGASNLADLPEVVKEAVGDIEVGALSVGRNLLRNSGFTGDYRPTEVKAADVLTAIKEVYSDSLKYWEAQNATVQQSELSQSGVEVVLANGTLNQSLKDEIIVGETYIFSFYAKGESLNFAVAGITQTRTLTDTYERYVSKFKAVKNNPTLQIRNANATICMLQLERGNVPTAWGVSVYDNDKSLAYYQALQYLSSAIKDGSVDILGGLILANMLLLGNYQNGEMQQVTAGVSGVYNDDDDVAFWAGGPMEKAITTVRRFRENPRYQPTDEEWADMANFVATHGGDLFIKGYIFALGGFFRGTVSIANGKILLNEDGSGRLSNGALEWDKEGRLYKNFPDMINWRSLRSSNIDYSKGGYYIAESLSEQSFTLATPPVMPYRVVLKAADAITTDHKNVTLIAQDGARFFYVHPDDPNTFYGGMFMTITTTNNAAKGLIELTRNGATWDVFVPSTMTVGTTGMITDILIF